MGILDNLFGGKKPGPAKSPAPPPAASAPPPPAAESPAPPEPPDISSAEAQAKLAAPGAPQLLDVREPRELQQVGWIPGSIHIPMNSIPDRIAELDSSRPVIVYCAAGVRSYDIGCYLLDQGFKEVFNLEGGINDWDGERERSG